MKTVRFIKSHSIYNAGEVAGFPDGAAQRFIDAGVAVAWEAATSEMPSEADQAPAPKAMTAEEELAAMGVDTSTKEDTEEEMKQKALRRPPKDRMVRGSQTK